MYKFINENAEAILEEAENTYKDGLRGYVECYLKTLKWEELNSANKKEYIRNYKKFYAMNAARLSSEFYNKYFDILCSGEKKTRRTYKRRIGFDSFFFYNETVTHFKPKPADL